MKISRHPYVSIPLINCWKSRRLQSGNPCNIYCSFNSMSSSSRGSATKMSERKLRMSSYSLPVSMNSCAAMRSSSSFSGVSSGPAGSRAVAGIPFKRYGSKTSICGIRFYEISTQIPCELPIHVLGGQLTEVGKTGSLGCQIRAISYTVRKINGTHKHNDLFRCTGDLGCFINLRWTRAQSIFEVVIHGVI